MSANSRCHHPGKTYEIESMALEEHPGKIFVRMRVKCEHCGARFRFVGIDPGANPDAPAVNRKGTDVLFPMLEITR